MQDHARLHLANTYHTNQHNIVFWKVQSDGQQRALHYRHKIVANEKINAFKPKELEPTTQKLNMRAAMMGAIYHKKYNMLPQNEWCKLCWEAGSDLGFYWVQ